MGLPLRSFAADAHGCIMVRSVATTAYKAAARCLAPERELPSDVGWNNPKQNPVG